MEIKICGNRGYGVHDLFECAHAEQKLGTDRRGWSQSKHATEPHKEIANNHSINNM